MAYSDFLEEINIRTKALFSEISAEYNFDNGPEFEIALCKLFRILLPNKYGICRGFVVSKDGTTAGDDIIIFDQERFPTLRLLQTRDFGQKEKIPIEAVYAYIEAKHTLCLEGTGGQSLEKSLSQIKAVKDVPRAKVPMTQITPQVAILSYNANRPPYWPDYRNPLYTAIISRHVRLKENSPIVEADKFLPLISEKCIQITQAQNAPDVIISGSDIICIPSVGSQMESPFFMPGVSSLSPVLSKERAFSAGLTIMLYAFDHITLGTIHWPSVIAYGLNLALVNSPK